MRLLSIVLLVSIFIGGCSSDEGTPAEMALINVDPEFQQYVDEFIEEATKRGQDIDFSDTGLTVQFSELALTEANGRCFFASHLIEINKADWVRFSPSFRTYLLFHELGHCELRRGHTNDKFQDQSWMSIMKGSPFIDPEGRIPVPFFGFRRDYYIDELFDPNTPKPDWADKSFNVDTDFPKEQIDAAKNVNRISSFPRLSSDDYEIDLSFELLDQTNVWTTLEWGVQGAQYYMTIFPGFGFIVGVRDSGIDIPLHYRRNYNIFNGRPIENIVIRNHDGFEQIFVNEEQFFVLDGQENLDYITLSATLGDQRVNEFRVNEFTVSRITE